MTGCPDTSRLMAYMDGELRGTEASAVRSHIESCAACRRLVEEQALIERSYRDSFEAPSEESFRLMERRIMASVQAPPPRRRLPAYVPIAAALLIAAAGVRLAGRAGLLEQSTVETVTVTSVRDRVEPAGSTSVDSSAGAAGDTDTAAPDVPSRSDAVPEQCVQVSGEAEELQEQQAFSETGPGDGELPAAAFRDGNAPPVVGGSQDLAAGAGGGSPVASTGAGSAGLVSQTIDDSGDEVYYSLGTSYGRICDADQAAQEIATGYAGSAPGTEGDLSVSAVDVLARSCDAAAETVSGGGAQMEAACPYGATGLSSILILFGSDGEPVSPDSAYLDSRFPGWKDSLAGCMLDTALVVTCEEFSDLFEEQGAD